MGSARSAVKDALGRHQSGGGELRALTCDDCVGSCKQKEICSAFWPSGSLENEILEEELSR